MPEPRLPDTPDTPVAAIMPPALAALVARFEAGTAAGERDVSEPGGEIPVAHYWTLQRWEAEQQALFRGLPIVAAHSSEVPPGSALPFDALGTPIVITRDRDGVVRGFINVCRHRGMALATSEGPAAARARATLVCPYHGWTYALDGRLKHRQHAETFGDAGDGSLDLVPVRCEEVAGLIFVSLAGETAVGAEAWLGDVADDLRWLGLERMVTYRCVDQVYPANWKLTADAFLETYHIRVLHRDTIYPFFADSYWFARNEGAHISLLAPRRRAFEPHAPAADRDALCRLTTPTQQIFPNTFLIWHPDYVSLIRMYSPAPDRVRWIHTMLIPPEKATPDWQPHWDKTFGLIEQTVFQREDIATAVAIQAGLHSGANTVFKLGRLEASVARFHRNIAAHVDRLGP
jgi:phenylpropionate dioxygenase-like ring-hydroxylating dioxygenase large terminal subunit